MDRDFIVEKSLYDIAATDLREIWEAEIDPAEFKMEEEWSQSLGQNSEAESQVIIHDRLMSDAVLDSGGDTPIKSEHSYCSQLSSHSAPSATSSTLNALIRDADADDELLLPAMPPRPTMTTVKRPISPPMSFVVIKKEPISEPASPASSTCSSQSSSSVPESMTVRRTKKPISMRTVRADSSHETAPVKRSGASILWSNSNQGIKRKHQMISANVIKLENSSASNSRFTLPPTPPSCASSDTEGNSSPIHPSSPVQQTLYLSAAVTTRQPIHTPLISSQPKGSTGVLYLTEEEKRTLVAEGYPVPVRLPLTKAEEKCLKKIRRKIKNKISAQESRRKKKEYMDALEKKVELLSTENFEYKQVISSLENSNSDLINQVSKLQNIIARLGGANRHLKF
ncbi:bZIP transcription factor [Nesidiocoris tenuis]|uniref:BZIP transcription factor n=1 Tax=Nesidiocoris tenuis TaxID=355587 RepID=A0ABN7ADM6_9HEMI|nr:bZIP transcription factor [Nesidiocoris tenuis]